MFGIAILKDCFSSEIQNTNFQTVIIDAQIETVLVCKSSKKFLVIIKPTILTSVFKYTCCVLVSVIKVRLALYVETL